jgi:hypothetical protein
LNKLFLLCLLLPFSAFAEDTLINTAETLAFGVFTSYGKKSVTGSATDDAPPLDTVKTYRFRDFTNRIPMQILVSIGKGHLHGYGFDEKWEMLPGEWTFEVWYKKARLVKRSFTVFDPEKETLEPSE